MIKEPSWLPRSQLNFQLQEIGDIWHRFYRDVDTEVYTDASDMPLFCVLTWIMKE